MNSEPVSIAKLVEYEIMASWWVGFCPFHQLAVKYFVWKVKRKYTRYKNQLARVRYIKRNIFLP